MKVAVFPSDDGGCGWYRLKYPATVLQAQGHDVVIDPPDMAFYRNADTDQPISVDLDADVAVVQRVTRRIAVDFVATLKAAGHRVIVDVDDDLDALHPHHPYRGVLDGDTRSADNLHAACQLADAVTVTTQPLADRYGYGKAIVLPNLVPASYLRVKARRKGPLRVGWTGRPQSHVGDALVMGGRVGPVVAAAGARFAAWGQTADVTFGQVGVPLGARVAVPFRPLRSGFPESVAELSVGLVPLQPSPFNVAKSWLKGIEHTALGVPFVASPLPEYVKLHDLGVGLLADSPDEWAEHVGRLLASPSERAGLAEAGRAVMASLTYEAHAGRWWDAWTGTGVDDGLPATAMVAGAGTAAPVPA